MSCAKSLIIGIQGHALTLEEEALIQAHQLAGVILFGRNIQSVEQLQKLIASIQQASCNELFISLDLEGGRVNRLSALGLELPSAAALAQAGKPEWIADQARMMAQAMNYFGFNLNYAPVLDIDEGLQVQNALGGRCWGENPETVISNVSLWINSFRLHSSALLVGKHFPGSGYAKSDPHEDLPVVKRSLNELNEHELKPFVELAPQLDAMMSSHLLYEGLSEHPASLSTLDSELGGLRKVLNFDGLWVTDDLDMGAITQGYGQVQATQMAIDAEFNLCLICHETQQLTQLIESVSISKTPALNVPTCINNQDVNWQSLVNESKKLTQAVAECLIARGLVQAIDLPSSAVEDY